MVRPIEHRNPAAVIVALIGAFFLGSTSSLADLGVDARSLPSLFPNGPTTSSGCWAHRCAGTAFGTILVLIVLVSLLWVLFNKTKVGLAMRAVANNQESSGLVGIRVGRILVIGWGLAGAIGCWRPVCSHPPPASPAPLMLGPFLLASAAAVLGGLDSPVGAVVGGLAIGLVKALSIGYVLPG